MSLSNQTTQKIPQTGRRWIKKSACACGKFECLTCVRRAYRIIRQTEAQLGMTHKLRSRGCECRQISCRACLMRQITCIEKHLSPGSEKPFDRRSYSWDRTEGSKEDWYAD